VLPLDQGQHHQVPRVPGALASHYAPRIPCHRVEAAHRSRLPAQVWAEGLAFISMAGSPATPLPVTQAIAAGRSGCLCQPDLCRTASG
jgi:L-threonylcarbamoyladenylate synthase